ncbi:MAG TPA: hypothetical protein VF704_01160 [Allosphingosinicella sp.]|jgi:large-conductance mechanosensitive channel
MTISLNGAEIGEAIAIASVVGSIVAFLIVAFVIYLVVRPPRRRPIDAAREEEALDVAEMVALIERMERRLEVLERAVGSDERDNSRILEAAEGPELGRKQ